MGDKPSMQRQPAGLLSCDRAGEQTRREPRFVIFMDNEQCPDKSCPLWPVCSCQTPSFKKSFFVGVAYISLLNFTINGRVRRRLKSQIQECTNITDPGLPYTETLDSQSRQHSIQNHKGEYRISPLLFTTLTQQLH